jgi:hypothetical protein
MDPSHSTTPLIRRRHDALIKEMLAAEDLPTLALDNADAFDYHFMAHLMGKLQASTDQAVRVEIGQQGQYYLLFVGRGA